MFMFTLPSPTWGTALYGWNPEKNLYHLGGNVFELNAWHNYRITLPV